MKRAALEQMAAGCVRPLEERDVPQIVDLHARVLLGKANPAGPPTLRTHIMQQILLHHPWCNPSLPSLVFQENDGRITGCLGVMPRPLLFQGREITAAVSHTFVVEPGSRSTLAALELAKRFVSGPQDLSLAEGNNASRKIWERIGGTPSLIYSLGWTRPLRPGQYALSFLRRRGLSPVFGWALRPLSQLVDAIAPSIAQRPFRLPVPTVTGAELDAVTLENVLTAFTRDRPLRPRYDGHSTKWLLEALSQKQGRGTLRKVVVRDGGWEPVGWYLYYGNAGGLAEVVQIGARDGYAEHVFDHLFYHARREGIVAVSGQVDPAFFQVISKKDCLFHHDAGSWMLVHSRNPELRHALHQGDAFLTRLEGEWWISRLLS